MRILSRHPWYRWHDRWSLHVEAAGDFWSTTPIVFICPPGYRWRPNSITGVTATGPTGPYRYLRIRLFRAQHLIAFTFMSTAIAAAKAYTFAFNYGGNYTNNVIRANHIYYSIPESFVMLPGDRFQLDYMDAEITDRITNVVFTARQWLD